MDNAKAYSNKQPIWQLTLLIFCTFGLYEIYWFYRNWKQLYPHNQVDVTPWLRTVGLFIPIVWIVLAWSQFLKISEFAKRKNINSFRHPHWFAIIFFIADAITTLAAFLDTSPPIPIFAISLSSLLLIIPQKTINHYWEQETPTLPEKTKLSRSEIIICCIGGVLIIIDICLVLLCLLLLTTPESNEEHYLHQAEPITSSEHYYRKPTDTYSSVKPNGPL